MKKVINLTILSAIILSLIFIPTVQTNAASTVNITYYSSNGYFKAKPNRSKSKITIKNKINKNVAMLLPLDATDIVLLVGILKKKVVRNIQLLPSSKKSLSFILIG